MQGEELTPLRLEEPRAPLLDSVYEIEPLYGDLSLHNQGVGPCALCRE